jgi:NADH dehydrogenase FAD-containing subunit
LELTSFSNVQDIWDCASITNSFSERPYPPTDQHAIRQVQLAVENIINNLENKIQEKQDTKQEVQWQQLGKELEYQKYLD